MKTLAAVALGAVLGLGAWDWFGGPCCASAGKREPARDAGLTVQALEARSAAVFAGACHYMGEAQSNGREGLFLWELSGELGPGVTAQGLVLAAVVEGGSNLDLQGPRRSRLWIDARADREQARALERWVRGAHGELLGEVLGAETCALTFERRGDAFEASAPGLFELAGRARADRACCSMPEWRCYEPLAAPEGAPAALVGQADVCRFEGAPGLSAWAYEGENNVFLSAPFGPAPARSCCPPQRSQVRP